MIGCETQLWPLTASSVVDVSQEHDRTVLYLGLVSTVVTVLRELHPQVGQVLGMEGAFPSPGKERATEQNYFREKLQLISSVVVVVG